MHLSAGYARARQVCAHLLELDPEGTLSAVVGAQLNQSLRDRGYTSTLAHTMDRLLALPSGPVSCG